MIGKIILAHLAGDYLLQSGWMARGKKRRWWPAVAHGVVYTLPFLLLTRSPWALLVIAGTHVVIDRYQLARHVVWAREQLAPRADRPPRSAITDNHGSPSTVAPGMAHAMKIIIDNTMHLVINAAALTWLA
ncbi:DUF3307 domain-containing protein [Actinomadura miaoliensis]|uniref:DUF3307 domain-containing protein n=1 Tax=Actinomadura miaoliensis TaxID=430685 RepID=A0ABP7W830_9ACTN